MDCPAHLWAKKHDQYSVVLSEFEQSIMDLGKEVEKIAIDAFRDQFQQPHTNQIVEYQRTFTYRNFLARADILVYKPDTDQYDLYEVKSSTKVKEEHIHDVAFQTFVLSQTIHVDQVYIVHVNTDYIFKQELEADKFLSQENVTKQVVALQTDVAILSEQAFRMAELTNADQAAKCLKPKKCPCPLVCHPHLPEYSVFDIPKLDKKKKQLLVEKGLITLDRIPNNFPITSLQRQHIQCMLTGDEFVDYKRVRVEVSKYQYPLYFLDYETISTAIPMFEGRRPYEQLVFQYSLHILPTPGGELIHREALVISDQDPQPEIAGRLASDIGDVGTVLVWFKPFEKSMNKGMGEELPEYTDLFKGINQRVIDLGDVFSKGFYIHPKFNGSWSIKNVLPVVSPTLSYAGMGVSNGTQAMTAWLKASHPNTSTEEREQITNDLLRYCELDTLAMVEIYRFLRSKIGGFR